MPWLGHGSLQFSNASSWMLTHFSADNSGDGDIKGLSVFWGFHFGGSAAGHEGRRLAGGPDLLGKGAPPGWLKVLLKHLGCDALMGVTTHLEHTAIIGGAGDWLGPREWRLFGNIDPSGAVIWRIAALIKIIFAIAQCTAVWIILLIWFYVFDCADRWEIN